VQRLIIRPGALGDFVLSLPAMEFLRASYTEVWTRSAHLPLVQFADRTRAIASTGLDLAGVTEPPAELWDALRGFDSIVSWYGANRPEFREAVRDFPFTFHTALPPDTGMHAADVYLSQVGGIPGGFPRSHCDVPRQDFVVIHPFSGSRRKNWPLENFRTLATQLEQDCPVHWCRGPEDPPLPGAVEIDDLHQLARWFAQARLFIGNDSGVTHLAAAVGTPVLAFFGPTDSAVWAPRGPNVKIGLFSTESFSGLPGN
jgi:heptosyltransferase III